MTGIGVIVTIVLAVGVLYLLAVLDRMGYSIHKMGVMIMIIGTTIAFMFAMSGK
jgi:hypothetical protein